MSKYSALTDYLASRTAASFALTFAELRQIVDLPASATRHSAWWANSQHSHAHAATWLDAGLNATPDFNAGRVRFHQGRGRGAR